MRRCSAWNAQVFPGYTCRAVGHSLLRLHHHERCEVITLTYDAGGALVDAATAFRAVAPLLWMPMQTPRGACNKEARNSTPTVVCGRQGDPDGLRQVLHRHCRALFVSDGQGDHWRDWSILPDLRGGPNCTEEHRQMVLRTTLRQDFSRWNIKDHSSAMQRSLIVFSGDSGSFVNHDSVGLRTQHVTVTPKCLTSQQLMARLAQHRLQATLQSVKEQGLVV